MNRVTIRKKKIVLILSVALTAACIAGIVTVSLILNNSGFRETTITLEKSYSELFTEAERQKHLGDASLSSYLTDVSVAFQNVDGSTSLYVYAAPVNVLRNSKYEPMDTRIVNVNDDDPLRQSGFVYTVANGIVVPYYPKEMSETSGIRLSKDFYYDFGLYLPKGVPVKYGEKVNFVGDKKNMVTYKSYGKEISLYPSAIGTNCEIMFTKNSKENKLVFWLNIPDTGLSVSKEQGGYLVIHKSDVEAKIDGAPEKSIVGVIQPPLLKDSNNTVYYNNTVDVNEEADGRYKVEFAFDKAGLRKKSTAYISWEMRVEKQPDTALYSGKPDLQYAYLVNRSIVGNSPDYGIGHSLVRYRFCNPFKLEAARVQQANYFTYDLSRMDKSHPRQRLQLNSVLEDWCSVLVNWNEKLKIGGKISEYGGNEPVLNFNITEEVKGWCGDPTGLAERKGVLLKFADENAQTYDVVLSNDNALFRNRTEIILK